MALPLRLFFAAALTFVLALLVRNTLSSWNRYKHERTASATVVDSGLLYSKGTKDEGPSTIQTNSYRFTVNGQEYSGKFHSDPEEMAVGERIDVLYFESDPRKNRPMAKASTFGDYVFPILLLFSVAVAIVKTLMAGKEG